MNRDGGRGLAGAENGGTGSRCAVSVVSSKVPERQPPPWLVL